MSKNEVRVEFSGRKDQHPFKDLFPKAKVSRYGGYWDDITVSLPKTSIQNTQLNHPIEDGGNFRLLQGKYAGSVGQIYRITGYVHAPGYYNQSNATRRVGYAQAHLKFADGSSKHCDITHKHWLEATTDPITKQIAAPPKVPKKDYVHKNKYGQDLKVGQNVIWARYDMVYFGTIKECHKKNIVISILNTGNSKANETNLRIWDGILPWDDGEDFATQVAYYALLS